MTDLERLIREALDAGSTSERVAQDLTDILNRIKMEETAEERKKEEEARKAREKVENHYKTLVAECNQWWTAHTGYDIKTAARMGAITALHGVFGNSDNRDWTIEDIDSLVQHLSESMEFILEAYKGHASPEERTKYMLTGLMSDIEDVVGSKADNLLKGLFERGDKLNTMTGRGMDAVRDWIMRNGL